MNKICPPDCHSLSNDDANVRRQNKVCIPNVRDTGIPKVRDIGRVYIPNIRDTGNNVETGRAPSQS